jgi:hypothetical protein
MAAVLVGVALSVVVGGGDVAAYCGVGGCSKADQVLHSFVGLLLHAIKGGVDGQSGVTKVDGVEW